MVYAGWGMDHGNHSSFINVERKIIKNLNILSMMLKRGDKVGSL